MITHASTRTFSRTQIASDDITNSGILSAKLMEMISRFEHVAHIKADLDPLGADRLNGLQFSKERRKLFGQTDLSLKSFGISDSDGDIPIAYLTPILEKRLGLCGNRPARTDFKATVSDVPVPRTVKELHDFLLNAYTRSIGFEFSHVCDKERRAWLAGKIAETSNVIYSPEMKRSFLKDSFDAVNFEAFIAQKFPTVKRFGLEGCESYITGLKQALRVATAMGGRHYVIGMAHRGRLNTLANIVGKPLETVYSELQGNTPFGKTEYGGYGDVKYHLGRETRYEVPEAGKDITVTLMPNPSHLETVNGVTMGYARAIQSGWRGENAKGSVIPILVHGDAAVAGQGVVMETLQMGHLKGYDVGGTMHVVINNQVGFTTNVEDSLSSIHCTDIAKSTDAPVFHVNAQNPEAVALAFEIAAEYRQTFHSDVFIDVIGWRKLGHNELDMPLFTNPSQYHLVSQRDDVASVYAKHLIETGVIQSSDYATMTTQYKNMAEAALASSKKNKPTDTVGPFNPAWSNYTGKTNPIVAKTTGISVDRLKEIGKEVFTVPTHLQVHPTVGRIYDLRLKTMQNEDGLDFGTAEALAYLTLAEEGHPVRIAGEDSERGTFSHRHAVLHDQKTGNKFNTLTSYAQKHGFSDIEIVNSHLSEYGAVSFETGVAMYDPKQLTIWEAQFGDFANGAQIMFDQYLCSQETKWNLPTGITLLLPHGYDGQGPEHSSCRIERFLSLSDDRQDVLAPSSLNAATRRDIQFTNMQVCNVSTAASLFHLLRRQATREFRKPLVIATPKKLLRFRSALSRLSEFGEGTRFTRYISDPSFTALDTKKTEIGKSCVESTGNKDRSKVRRLIICSGQVYYDLIAARKSANLENEILISRAEQIAPFPVDQLAVELESLPSLETVVWAQEEPMNMGCWSFVEPRINTVLAACESKVSRVIYAGRDINASPATGDSKLHNAELAKFTADAMNLSRNTNSHIEHHTS